MMDFWDDTEWPKAAEEMARAKIYEALSVTFPNVGIPAECVSRISKEYVTSPPMTRDRVHAATYLYEALLPVVEGKFTEPEAVCLERWLRQPMLKIVGMRPEY